MMYVLSNLANIRISDKQARTESKGVARREGGGEIKKKGQVISCLCFGEVR